MGTGSNLAEQVVGIDRNRLFAIAGIGALLLSVLIAVSAYANHFTTAGEPELYNLEHIYNFNPAVLDGNTDLFPDGVAAGDTKGTDVEFFTHSVPLRDYSTGQLVDEMGNPVTEPVYGERDFAVMGSYDRGGVIFDITDPDNRSADLVVADGTPWEMGTLGSLGVVPGWPGEDAYPPQQMVAQVRGVLDAYAQRGGAYREEVFEGSGHAPHIDAAEEWMKVFFEFLS